MATLEELKDRISSARLRLIDARSAVDPAALAGAEAELLAAQAELEALRAAAAAPPKAPSPPAAAPPKAPSPPAAAPPKAPRPPAPALDPIDEKLRIAREAAEAKLVELAQEAAASSRPRLLPGAYVRHGRFVQPTDPAWKVSEYEKARTKQPLEGGEPPPVPDEPPAETTPKRRSSSRKRSRSRTAKPSSTD